MGWDNFVSIIIFQLTVTIRYAVAGRLKGVIFKNMCNRYIYMLCMSLQMCINPKYNQPSPNKPNKREWHCNSIPNQWDTSPVSTQKEVIWSSSLLRNRKSMSLLNRTSKTNCWLRYQTVISADGTISVMQQPSIIRISTTKYYIVSQNLYKKVVELKDTL